MRYRARGRLGGMAQRVTAGACQHESGGEKVSEQIEKLPVLPIKNNVLFPGLLMPLTAGRPTSIAAIDAALASEDKEILVITQREMGVEAPGANDFYSFGTKGIIKRIIRRQDGAVNLIVQGVERAVLIRIDQTDPYLQARVRLAPVPEEKSTELEALRRA